MPDTAERELMRAAVSAQVDDLAEDARAFFAKLGYESGREMPKTMLSAQAFLDTFQIQRGVTDNGINESALRDNADKVAIVCQFGDDEIKAANSGGALFSGKLRRTDMQSFLFVAIDLKPHPRKKEYGRGLLARMTRAINRRLAMPAVVFFRYQDDKDDKRLITLSFVHRRPHKTDKTRDTIGRVSMLRAISRATPHRGHLDILADLTIQKRMQWITKEKSNPPDFETLLAAWLYTLDIDALNRNFYKDLKEWFEWATKEATFPEVLPANEHITRLLTRLLFVWFMKEKGLVAEEWFIADKMTTLLKTFNNKGDSDYYRAVLQNLFFATLNAKIEKRGFSSQEKPAHRISSLYRYRSLIADEQRFNDLMKKTPFVNGGLFDCLDEGHNRGKRADMFSDPDPIKWRKAREEAWKRLCVPDDLFFNKTRGLIRIFNRYKFTVQENTPIEQEVALDPELLGNVFEDLLDWIIKKQAGAYYTPRTIVDYMADESITAAIIAKCAPRERRKFGERLRALLNYGIDYETDKSRFDNDESARIVRAIADIKVLDPAVGSGAFPMGVLHKLTLALRRLDPQNKHWQKIQIERAQKRAARAFDEQEDKEERERELKEINDIFHRYRDSDYGRKLYLIQNSIFGVDIQPVACQIAKLRFFISLVIEQQTDDKSENFGIKPLPNLETRIIAADTLMPLYTGQSTLTSEKAKTLEAQLNANRERHFHATNYETKKECRAKDTKLRKQLADQLTKDGLTGDSPQKIAAWNPYDTNTPADWFNAEYMFGIDGGFDIVIGNPPYVRQELFKDKKAALKAHYGKFYCGTADLYTYFYRRGFSHLLPGGHLSFITSNKFMRTGYGKNLRRFLMNDATMHTLIDFGELPVFRAGTDPAIVIAKNTPSPNDASLTAAVVKSAEDIPRIAEYVKERGFSLPVAELSDSEWTVEGGNRSWQLLMKMRSTGRPLKHIIKHGIHYGVKTGCDSAFLIDEKTKAAMIAEDIKSAEIIKPWLRGREIKKWRPALPELYGLFVQRTTDISRYPAVKKHLLQFKRFLLKRASPKAEHWFSASAEVAYSHEFAMPKIIYPDIALAMRASFDDTGVFSGNTTFIMPTDDLSILGFLHSKAFDWFARHTFQSLGDTLNRGRLRFLTRNMLEVPFPPMDKKDKAAIARRVKTIMKNPDCKNVASLEAEIDKLVYALYDLTEEEIATIEKRDS